MEKIKRECHLLCIWPQNTRTVKPGESSFLISTAWVSQGPGPAFMWLTFFSPPFNQHNNTENAWFPPAVEGLWNIDSPQEISILLDYTSCSLSATVWVRHWLDNPTAVCLRIIQHPVKTSCDASFVDVILDSNRASQSPFEKPPDLITEEVWLEFGGGFQTVSVCSEFENRCFSDVLKSRSSEYVMLLWEDRTLLVLARLPLPSPLIDFPSVQRWCGRKQQSFLIIWLLKSEKACSPNVPAGEGMSEHVSCVSRVKAIKIPLGIQWKHYMQS